ncbi:MAG TPA: encapsulin-associated ferritin-like protein [Miltoncostaeaceae bacterium]|nr:encapsulin-associated ferritin-like protein [Miltoncostaeaceae bacterium]
MGLHEAREDLAPATLDRHRGLVSLVEELEAMDWYQQRIDAAGDPELEAVLAHNRDEETEHAAMSLEWLRRQDPVLDEHLREYLFTEGPIVRIEEEIEGGEGGGGAPGDGSLGIDSLRGEG